MLILFGLLLFGSTYAEDPALQLYLDFESSEPDPVRGVWVLHDRSQNDFLVEFNNRGVGSPSYRRSSGLRSKYPYQTVAASS